MERITDYITYLENGRVIYTGDMDGLMQKYYLIKGEPAKLTNELKKDILGIRSTTIGFEGLYRYFKAIVGLEEYNEQFRIYT